MVSRNFGKIIPIATVLLILGYHFGLTDRVEAADALRAMQSARSTKEPNAFASNAEMLLTGSTWSGKDSDGDFWRYEFKRKGLFILTNGKGNTADGTWELGEDSSISMQVNDSQILFRCTLVDEQLQGTARKLRGDTWRWSAIKDPYSALSQQTAPLTSKVLIPYDWGFEFEPQKNAPTIDLRPSNACSFLQSAYSPDGKTVAKRTQVGSSYQYYDVISLSGAYSKSHYGTSVAFSPDGASLAVGQNASIELFGISSNIGIASFTAPGFVHCLAFSPDGKYLAAEKYLIEIATGKVIKKLNGFESFAKLLAFTPDGRLLIVGEHDRNIRIYDVTTGNLLKSLPIMTNAVSFLNGNTLVVKGDNSDTLTTSWEYKRIGLHGTAYTPLYDQNLKYNAFLVKSAQIEKDVAKEKQSTLLSQVGPLKAEKDEFEKNSEYEQRKKKAQELEAKIFAEYTHKLKALLAIAEQEKQAWQKLLASSLYPFDLDVQLGAYDPDKEVFTVKVFEQHVSIPVQRDVAVRLKKNKIKVEGKVRYYNDSHVELVNAYLTKVSTGDRIAFGNHLEPVMVASTEKTPPQLIITSLTISEPSGNGILDAGEKGKIRAVLKNSSKGTAFGVNAKFEPASALPTGITVEGQKYLGVINNGEEKVVEADITASEDIPAADIKIKALATETNGFDAKPVMLSFKSKALVPPALQIASIDIKSSDGKRVLSKGVQADLAVRVQNAGSGIARDVAVALNTKSKEIITYGTDSIKVGNLAPGESKEIVFSIAVNQRYQGGNTLPVSFVVKEERPRFTVKPNIVLALNEEVSDIRVVKVESKDTEPTKLFAIDDISVVPVLKATEKVFGENDIALVVGIERYQSFSEAKFAVNDAKLVEKYLMALGIPRRNIQLVTDEKATRGGIEKSLENWLPNHVKPNSRVFVYYSGHGTPDPVSGEPYIFPHDGDPSYLASTSYPLKRLYSSLAKLNVKDVIVVIDSCFSGSGERSVLALGTRPAIVKIDDPILNSNKMAVLTSTEGTQISTSMQDKKHGVFTYYFLKSIKEGKKNLGDIYTDIKPKIGDEAKRLNVNQSPALKPGIALVSGKYSMQK